MKNPFKEDIDKRLYTLDWHGEQQVLSRLKTPPKTTRIRPLAIACALVLALCATALALSLQYSEQHRLAQQAREALYTKYGLSDKALDVFSRRIERTDDGWCLTYKPLALNLEGMGVYTVRIHGEQAEASWSHDGTLSAPQSGVWDNQEIEQAMALRRENAAIWNEKSKNTSFDEMSLEERAALDAPLLKQKGAACIVNIAPQKDDLSEKEALAAAFKAISLKYGNVPDEKAGFKPFVSFYLWTEDQRREYHIQFNNPRLNQGYEVRLLSPGGEINECHWIVEPQNRSLPLQDLANHQQAAEEYANSGAFDLLPSAQKAEVARRFDRAGLRSLLPEGEYLSPEKTDLPENQMRQKADETMIATYGFTQDTLPFFRQYSALLQLEGSRIWQLTYVPGDKTDWRWGAQEDILGTYTLRFTSDGNQLLHYAWSLESIRGKEAYTPQTFGSAKAYSAEMLPWLLQLLTAQDAILSAYPPDTNRGHMSIEDDAAYDELMRHSGFDAANWPYTLPDKTDLNKEQALSLAKEALLKEYHLDARLLDQCEVLINCFNDYHEQAKDTPRKCWSLTFQGYGVDRLDIYTIVLDAKTGEVQRTVHDDPAGGNG